MKYHFSTKALVTIALLSALGGVLSTYIGYLGNMVNHIVGVPFGAGQFLSGLHVLWIVLAIGITKRKGAGTVTGLLKGVIELFLGSTHGVVIVVVSLVQGMIADALLFDDKAKANRDLMRYAIAGAFASASNVVVFQVFFFSGVPIFLIAMLCMLAAASGVIFAGLLPIEMMESLDQAGLGGGRSKVPVDVPMPEGADRSGRVFGVRKRTVAVAVTAVFLAAFTIGAVYYFAYVFVLPGSGSVEVFGTVESPYDFHYEDFSDQEVTVNAELIGSVTHVDPRDYTGIRLSVIVQEASPSAEANVVRVYGSDGYFASFELSDVLSDGELILIYEDGGYRLVAANYEGAYWVEEVVSIEVI